MNRSIMRIGPKSALNKQDTARAAIITDVIMKDDSQDQRDTLIQAQLVESVFASMGYETVIITFSPDLGKTAVDLSEIAPSVVFNLVESVEGRGDMIYLAPLLLEAMGLKYTGCPSGGIFLTTNKLLAKTIMSLEGIRTPMWLLPDIQKNSNLMQRRYIIKPVHEDASKGIDQNSIIESGCSIELAEAVKERQENIGVPCFAEEYIEGREFNVSLLETGGNLIMLPPSEILFKDWQSQGTRIVGYRAKWDHLSFEYQNTERSFLFAAEDESILEEIYFISTKCWRLFGLRGYARVDFRVDSENRPWVLEVNANPCLSFDGGFMASALENGMRPSSAISSIVEEALSQKTTGHTITTSLI